MDDDNSETEKQCCINVEQEDDSDPLPGGRNVYVPAGLRRGVLLRDGLDRWLLEYNFGVLPVICVILYIIFSIVG